MVLRLSVIDKKQQAQEYRLRAMTRNSDERRSISPASSKNLFCVVAAGRVSRTASPEAASPFSDKRAFSPSCLRFLFSFSLLSALSL